MDYYRIDDSHFISLITWLPKVVVFEIVNFTYAKCVDCNHYLLKEYKCNKCNAMRCNFHAWYNMSLQTCHTCFGKTIINDKLENDEVIITCIIPQCTQDAWFGYKTSVHYCDKHYKNKYKIIGYNHCFIYGCFFKTNMIDKNTDDARCIIHMKPDTEYVYNYFKN